MTIWEIDNRLLDLVDTETGELLDYDAFMALQMEREAKIEGMALWYKELTAQAKAIREEIASLTERRRAAENKAARLVEYIGQTLNGEKFSTSRCAVSYRKSTALEVSDAQYAVAWLNRNGHKDLFTWGEPNLDKRAISKLCKDGEKIPGVELVERISTQIK